jgi:putative stress-induced transcription regulator/CGNR zinc finger protein
MPLTRDETRGSGVAVAVDLVNTWDELHPEPDLIEGIVDVRTWLEWHGLNAAAAQLGEDDVDDVRALRTRLDRIFDAKDEDEAAVLLNELAHDYGTPPRLERAGSGWQIRTWPDEGEGLPAIAAYAAAGLLEAFHRLGWKRFGRCAGAPCRCAFVDRSRNRSRRYCCSLCADRVAQAQYRARQRGAPPPRREAGRSGS